MGQRTGTVSPLSAAGDELAAMLRNADATRRTAALLAEARPTVERMRARVAELRAGEVEALIGGRFARAGLRIPGRSSRRAVR